MISGCLVRACPHQATYHLAVSLSSAVNCFASILVVVYNGKAFLGSLTGIDLALSAYILTLAVLSPVPPLVASPTGSALVVSGGLLVLLVPLVPLVLLLLLLLLHYYYVS